MPPPSEVSSLAQRAEQAAKPLFFDADPNAPAREFTTSEAVALLRCSKYGLDRAVASGRAHPRLIASRRLWTPAALEEAARALGLWDDVAVRRRLQALQAPATPTIVGPSAVQADSKPQPQELPARNARVVLLLPGAKRPV
jgi:hypothetical protein